MFDIKAIRENPETFDLGWKRRGIAPQSEALIALDSSLREKKTELQECQSRRNVASKSIGQAKAKGEDADDLIREVADLKARMATLEEDVRSIEEELTQKLGRLDNIPAEDVPDGESEDDNLEVRKWGDIPAFDFAPKQHFDLGEDLGQMDFEGAARMSGARFVILRGDLAKLERALSAFMLDVHTTDFGYEEASVPLLVREQALYGTSQLPKFKEDLFEATTGHYMIPTAQKPGRPGGTPAV